MRRDRRGAVLAHDEPAQLRDGIRDDLRTLGVESLPVVNLLLMRDGGPDAFFDDQLAAMIAAREEGLIDAIGLSNITVDHLVHALRFTGIACVQNPYHIAVRSPQPLLDEMRTRWDRVRTVRAARRRPEASVLDSPQLRAVAERYGHTPAQIALAWALAVAHLVGQPFQTNHRSGSSSWDDMIGLARRCEGSLVARSHRSLNCCVGSRVHTSEFLLLFGFEDALRQAKTDLYDFRSRVEIFAYRVRRCLPGSG